MTKAQITAMIQDLMDANTTPSRSKYDVRDIAILVGAGYSDAVTTSIIINYRGKRIVSSRIDGGFVTAFKDVPIVLDTDRQAYYSVLPAAIIQLPNDIGIRQISPMEDERTSWINSSIGQKFTQSLLEVSDYPKPITYQVENDRVYYDDKLPWQWKLSGAGVLMKLLRDINDIPDDEEFNIPGGLETKIIDWVFAKLGISFQAIPDNRSDANTQV